jgi:hypothetical protein
MTGGINNGVVYFGMSPGSKVPPGTAALARGINLPCEAAYNESMPAPLSLRKSRLVTIVCSFVDKARFDQYRKNLVFYNCTFQGRDMHVSLPRFIAIT